MKVRNKYRFGEASSNRLSPVSEYLQLTALKALSCSPIDFGVPWMGGLRTTVQQNAIFNAGNSRCNGYEKISYHQKTDDHGKGLALDLVPYIIGEGFCYKAYGRFGIIGMLMLEAWDELQQEGKIPKDKYLHWGGLWRGKTKKSLGWDMAHFEIRDYPQITML